MQTSSIYTQEQNTHTMRSIHVGGYMDVYNYNCTSSVNRLTYHQNEQMERSSKGNSNDQEEDWTIAATIFLASKTFA